MNIIKCKKCGRELIAEEFSTHKCEGRPIHRTITLFYEKFIHTEINGKEVALILTEDGTLYNVKPPKWGHPFRTPDKETVYKNERC